MCTISVEPKGLRNSKTALERMECINSDGMGFAFSTGKRIIIKKYRDFDKFYANYSRCKNLYGERSAFMLHFRIRTHGSSKGVGNVHPFRVNPELVFSHNGIISGVGESKTKSDTRLFNELILKRLSSNFLRDKVQRTLIETFIGYSKLGFISLDGGYEILNERKGIWSKGIWYSNDAFRPQAVQTVQTGWSGSGCYTSNYYGSAYVPNKPQAVKPQAVSSKPIDIDKQLQLAPKTVKECEWCQSNASVKAVGIRWLKGGSIEWEKMCIECERSARMGGAYSVHYNN